MLPPSIPTSFVPHPSNPARRLRVQVSGIFSFFSYGVLGIMLLMVLGVFFYGRIMSSERAAKDVALAKAEAAIDPATVESFVRLRNRLAAAEKLLSGHVAVSNFFTALGAVVPVTVRFTSLHLTSSENGSVQLEGLGTAKNFNALAAASNALAADGRIRDAIFSHIVVNQNGSVSFSLSAMLDPKLVAFTATAKATIPAAALAPVPQEGASTTAPL